MGRRSSPRLNLMTNLGALLVILCIAAPLLAVVLGAFQTERSLLADVRNPWPREVTLDNFRSLITGQDINVQLPGNIKVFPRAFANSVLVSMATTFITLALASLSAYAVARLRFRWVQGFMYFNLLTRMVPVVVLMIPLYIMLGNLRLLNSLQGLVATEVGFLLPYTIWILTAYFQGLPVELEDAARIDGCSRVGALFRIVLPLSAPGLAAAGVIVFMMSWHELFIPLIVSSRPESMTIPVVVSSLVTDYNVFYTLAMAVSLLGLLPTVILVLALQRYVVRGLTAGAVKG